MRKPRILLTAFEPFGGESCNSSQQVAEEIARRVSNDWDFRYRILPVTRYDGPDMATRELDDFSPDIMIMLGQAGSRQQITPERVAINLDFFHIPDNANQQPRGESICADGPVGYFSKLPVTSISERLRNAGFAAKVSNSAGLFVCNRVFYSVLHHIAQNELPVMAGLIHLPRISGQNQEDGEPDFGQSLETMVAAVELAMAECLQQLSDSDGRTVNGGSHTPGYRTPD